MKVAVPVLAPILRSDTQGRLLAAILAAPDEEHTITALAARAGTSLPTAIREIDRAEAAQLVTSRRLGNTRLVKANPANPLYGPYRDIILATYGPPAVIGGRVRPDQGHQTPIPVRVLGRSLPRRTWSGSQRHRRAGRRHAEQRPGVRGGRAGRATLRAARAGHHSQPGPVERYG